MKLTIPYASYQTECAKWPEDFGELVMPWGTETINHTWPYIAVCPPDWFREGLPEPADSRWKKSDRALMYHTDDLKSALSISRTVYVKQPDSTYRLYEKTP
jgi:hypothetical protein